MDERAQRHFEEALAHAEKTIFHLAIANQIIAVTQPDQRPVMAQAPSPAATHTETGVVRAGRSNVVLGLHDQDSPSRLMLVKNESA